VVEGPHLSGGARVEMGDPSVSANPLPPPRSGEEFIGSLARSGKEFVGGSAHSKKELGPVTHRACLGQVPDHG
jgi:hypothetical protein